MKTLPLPPLELLEEFLMLDETSPSGLRWRKVRTVNQRKPGDIAGTKRPPNNYWFVGIRTDKCRQYAAHRIVYYLKTGIDPGSKTVDHVSGLENPLEVRLATSAENSRNAKKWEKQTSSRYKGVIWRKDIRKWRARICVNRKKIQLGNFEDEKAAAVAYNEAAVKYFGEFARVNVIDD